MPTGVFKHKKHTKETLEKMKGRKSPNFWLGKKRPNTSGKNHWAYGKKRPEITGENHYLWKGGTSKVSHLVRQCFKYRQWRSDCFMRDNYVCQECGIKNGGGKSIRLEVDHLKSFKQIMTENKIKTLAEAENCEELWNINNGRTLCKSCHIKTENYGKYDR